MIGRFLSWLALAASAAALLAGCGSSKTSSQSTPPAATTTPAVTAAQTTTGRALSGAALAQSVATCKQAIQAQGVLPAVSKHKLEAVCEKAAKGDTAAVHRAAREVCDEVINRSQIPAGPAREQAAAACKKVK